MDSDRTVQVDALADESVTVLGAAPSIDASPAAATTLLSRGRLRGAAPEHLLQALETVPGINQVSEGHAAVPAIRGLARGRTLLLIDGARVTSERRVGPSATFLDPAVLEGIDVARGPGSVAYGSDALGGVISMRTRSVEADAPLRCAAARYVRRRRSGSARHGRSLEGLREGRHPGPGPRPRRRRLGQPRGRRRDSQLGLEGRRLPDRGQPRARRAACSTAGWQSDFGRDIERPRNNSNVVRFYYPYENSHRFTDRLRRSAVSAGLQQIEFTGFLGTFEQRTDQDRFATATTGRSIERADVSAKDFHVKGTAQKQVVGRARVEFGVDVNGRYGLEALDIIRPTTRRRPRPATRRTSRSKTRTRTDVGALSPGRLRRSRRWSAPRAASAATT